MSKSDLKDFDRKNIDDIVKKKIIILFQSAFNVSIFTFNDLSFVFSIKIESLKTFENVIDEDVSDSVSTALYKRDNFSLSNFDFV